MIGVLGRLIKYGFINNFHLVSRVLYRFLLKEEVRNWRFSGVSVSFYVGDKDFPKNERYFTILTVICIPNTFLSVVSKNPPYMGSSAVTCLHKTYQLLIYLFIVTLRRFVCRSI